MDILKSLNPQQVKAVTAKPGPVLVLAGPGSGKTRVLTHRAAYLIGEGGIRPFQVMAVTFTNKAATEMGLRIAALLGQQTHGLTLGTVHATCARILRVEAEHLPVALFIQVLILDRLFNHLHLVISLEDHIVGINRKMLRLHPEDPGTGSSTGGFSHPELSR
ncbi:MAG: UvrD-helicase domain-containing protein [Anaerolineales bacterium]